MSVSGGKEKKQCEICGTVFSSEISVCEDCVKKGITVENAIELGREDKKLVQINGFAAKSLTEDEINDWLERIIRYSFTNDSKAVKDFLFEFPELFSEFLIYKEKNRQWREE